jgi:hypothetical protein
MRFLLLIIFLFTNHSFSNERVISYKYLVKSTKESTIDTLIYKKLIPGTESGDRELIYIYETISQEDGSISKSKSTALFFGFKSEFGEELEIDNIQKHKLKDLNQIGPIFSPIFAFVGMQTPRIRFDEIINKKKIKTQEKSFVNLDNLKIDSSHNDWEILTKMNFEEKVNYIKNKSDSIFKDRKVFENKSKYKKIQLEADYSVLSEIDYEIFEKKIKCLVFESFSYTSKNVFETTYYYSDKYGFMFIEIDFNDYKLTLELVDYNVNTN